PPVAVEVGAAADAATIGAFLASSAARFSPKSASPSRRASRTRSGGTVFDTATRRTSSGDRPALAHAAAILARTSRTAASRRAASAPSSGVIATNATNRNAPSAPGHGALGLLPFELGGPCAHGFPEAGEGRLRRRPRPV